MGHELSRSDPRGDVESQASAIQQRPSSTTWVQAWGPGLEAGSWQGPVCRSTRRPAFPTVHSRTTPPPACWSSNTTHTQRQRENHPHRGQALSRASSFLPPPSPLPQALSSYAFPASLPFLSAQGWSFLQLPQHTLGVTENEMVEWHH